MQQQAQTTEHDRARHDGDAFGRPCVALSWNIMQLYRRINSKYSEERRRRHAGPKYNDGYDDKHGHYLVYAGEEIWGRYTVQGVLGRGSFGTVLRCFDEKHQEQVAAKVVRNGEYFFMQGRMEVDIVSRLNNIAALDNLVVRLRKVFVWKNHLVLVFEMLSMNLFQLIRLTNFNGVSLDLTRKFAYQLVLVLKQLEEHDPPIIHSDVKPENVVLRDSSRSSIRLIDFGSACYMKQGATLYKYVQSRFYRSVEVILELNYDTAIDRWSLGCMLVELHTGVPLFPGKTEVDQIARFNGVLGPIPDDMIERSSKKDKFFHDSRQSHHRREAVAELHGEDVGEEKTSTASGRGQEVVSSPSPVIAADVLHNLSTVSSISAVTTVSGPQGPCSSVAPTMSGSWPTTAAATSSNGRALARNSLCVPSSGTVGGASSPSCNAVGCGGINTMKSVSTSGPSAMRRPMTAVNVTSGVKKGWTTPTAAIVGAGKECSTTVAAWGPRLASTSGTKSQKAPAPANMGSAGASLATSGGSASNNLSGALGSSLAGPSSRSITGLRPANSAPKLRSAVSGQYPTLGGGTSPQHTVAAQPPGRVSTPPQQEAVSRSPFTLRVPPAPEQCQSLADIIGVYTGGPRGCRRGQAGHNVEDYLIFLDFIQRLLCYDPRKRLSCADALRHPFLAVLETQKQWKHLGGGMS